MLILIGVAPTAYALNRALPESHVPAFVAASQAASKDRRRPRRRLRDHRRSAPGGHRLRPRAQDLRGHLSLAVGAGEADRRPGPAIRLARQGAGRQGAERPQRHVSASEALRILAKDKDSRAEARGSLDAQRLQEAARSLDQVHPELGQDLRRHRARPRHDDRLEAHRRSPSARRSARRT